MEKIYFSVNGIEYFIQAQSGRNYKEIIKKETGRRAANQKQVCRYYGIDVSADAYVMNTHQAINELINRINNKKDNYKLHYPKDNIDEVSTQDDFLSENQIKDTQAMHKILNCNGNSYTFNETKLFFEKTNYSNVFADKNNKTLAQTIKSKEYLFLEKETKNHYFPYLDAEVGTFLKLLKDRSDMFYKRFLNKYGDLIYSRFYMTDANMLTKKGLYIYCVNDDLKYIGRSLDPFEKRINSGYGRISPKNCYLDGQSTNCHLNALITQYKEHIHLLLLPMDNDESIKEIEKSLITIYSPAWNIQK